MKFSRVFILIFVLLFLAACGGGEEDTAETAEQPAANAEADLAGDSTAEDEPDAAEEAAEAAPPTDEPAPTDVPPTEPPATAEPTVEPTPVPEPTAEPQPETSDAGWGESGSEAQTACDNPYMPMRTGSTWTFGDNMGNSLIWEILDVQGDIQTATATMQMTIPDQETEEELVFLYVWECSADGGVSSFDFASSGLAQLGANMEMEIVEGSGYFLPTGDDFTTGDSWDSDYKTTFTFSTDQMGDEEIIVTGEMDVDQTNTVLGTEPVTINEITADGLQIEQVSTMLMTMVIMDQAVENEVPLSNIMELGRGIGIIRQTSDTDFGESTMELVEWFIP